MNTSKTALIDQFVELTQGMYVHLRPQGPEEWSDLELTMPQARALMLLNQGPQRMGSIASHLSCSMPSATSMVDRLVGKRLVERTEDAADRRLVLCGLMPLGQEEMDRFWRIGRMHIEAMADALTVDELQTVVQAMELLYTGIRRRAQGNASQETPPGNPFI